MKGAKTELLFRSNFIAIEYNYEDDWMYANWRNTVTRQEVVIGCNEILRHVVERQVLDILNDNTHVEGIWSGASKWVGKEWFPMIREAGVRHFAWVYSPSMLSRLSMDKTLTYATDEEFIKTFDDIDEATDWLRAKKL